MSVCEYCKEKFSSNNNLQRHKKTAKFCIDIQKNYESMEKEKEKKFICNYCTKKLSAKNRLYYHQDICKKNPNRKIKERNNFKKKVDIMVQQKFEELVQKNELQVLPTTITNANNTNANNTITQSNNDHSFNTNYISIINYMTPERVGETFEKHYTLDDLMKSQVGLADFTNEHFLNGSDKPMYLCTDKSRQHFVFYDENQEKVSDNNAKMLINLAIQGFESVTEMYKNKHEELKTKLNKFLDEEDCDDLVNDLREEIKALDEHYAKTMNIKKDGNMYRTQLSHVLPSTVTQKTRQEELLEKVERRAQEYKDRKEKEKEKVKDSVASTAPKQIPTETTEEVCVKELLFKAKEDYKKNPDKVFPMKKNSDGMRLVCGFPATKFSSYRNLFREKNHIKLPVELKKSSELFEEYIYWLNEEVAAF